ncbi:MAG: sulfotransferase [Phycisphaerales bacterium]|nr:sulfotransferase [Phycisphaerales bacterium]
MPDLKPPILVIGGTRSGTSMLARVLGDAPGLACWYEPNTLWRIGHAYRGSERATPADAKPWVTRRIRREFLKFQEANEGRRVVEKSPPNALRIAFVHAVLPEAKIIHIYRDGRAMLRSQIDRYEKFESYNVAKSAHRDHIFGRLAITPWWEWPAYLPRFADGFARRLVGKKVGWFGIRHPGWKSDRRRLTRTQVIARQWSVALELSLPELEALPPGSWLNLRYEDVVTEPVPWFRAICRFCGVEPGEAYFEMVRERVHAGSLHKWKDELSQTELDDAMPIMEPMLRRLGYVEPRASDATPRAAAS